MRGRPPLPLPLALPLLLLLGGPLPGAPAPEAGCPGAPLPHRALLDAAGQYWLRWGPRGARLAFRLEARTAGYVGLGFSPSGSMAAADLVLGGVAHGRPYLQHLPPSLPFPCILEWDRQDRTGDLARSQGVRPQGGRSLALYMEKSRNFPPSCVDVPPLYPTPPARDCAQPPHPRLP